jgi:hypothetical protein
MAKQVAPENVVGRDQLIARMWRTIDQDSVVFTAERRIGKTTVMKKMEAEPPEGLIVLYADLEKVDTPVRFVETLLADLKKYLTNRANFTHWFGDFVASIGGTEVGGIIKIPQRDKKDWQSVLEKSLSCACSNQSDRRLIFLWDEIPYMLQKINALERESGSNDHSALAILDSLRAMRNQNSNLRMIFTGSVGLHHVLADLRGNQFASQPANDMDKIDIGPLTLEHAAELARDLLVSEEIECSSQDAVIEQLVLLTDCVPFYIHRVVSKLAMLEGTVTPAAVESEVNKCLTDHSDPWEMEHFRDRLKIYYRGTIQNANGVAVETASVAKFLLNNLANVASPQSIDQCYADLKSKLPIEDRDLVIELLKSLTHDHYLERDQDGRYSFRFPLVQRWWVKAEGLDG